MTNIIYQKLVGDFISKHSSTIFIYMIATFCTWPSEAIFLSRQYSKLIESIKKKTSIDTIFNFKENIKRENIFGVLTLISFIWFILIVFYRVKFSLEEKIIPLFMSHIRQTLVESIMKSNSNDFNDIKSGEVLAKINDITFALRSMIVQTSGKLLPLGLGLITISVYYTFINPIIGGSFFIMHILQLIHHYYSGLEYSKKCAKRDKTYFLLNEQISDTLNNSMNIHLNNTLEYESNKNKDMNIKHDIDQENEMKHKKDLVMQYNVITIVIFVLMVILSYKLFTKKNITLPILITIVFIEIKLVGTMIEFDSTSLHFFQGLGTILATSNFLNKIFKDKNDKKNCNSKTYDIEIKNMSFRYNNNTPYIFKDMDLKINRGDNIGIIGQSGSGKSTLMKILLGLHKITKGSIKIGNCYIENISDETLRNKISYINQKTQLFNESILKNIQYGNDNLTEEEILNYMKKFDLDIVYSGLNNGIQTNAGVNGSKLSLGMQKITILLRGIFKTGDIMIFDEPLTGLDAKTKNKVIQMIDNINSQKTVIVITHDDEILSRMDEVYNLKDLNN